MDSNLKFEKTLFLKPLYFKNKETLMGFIENVSNLFFNNVESNKQVTLFTLHTEFGKISSDSLIDLGIISEFNNLHSFKLFFKHNSKLIININEFDTIKDKSYIKIYGTSLDEITKICEQIKNELNNYTNRFSFIHKEIIQAITTLILAMITIYYFYGLKTSYSISFYGFVIFTTIFYIGLIKLIASIFVPSFRLNTKISLLRKAENYYNQKKDSFIFKLFIWALPILISVIVTFAK